jgi:hypothetical protein
MQAREAAPDVGAVKEDGIRHPRQPWAERPNPGEIDVLEEDEVGSLKHGAAESPKHQLNRARGQRPMPIVQPKPNVSPATQYVHEVLRDHADPAELGTEPRGH